MSERGRLPRIEPDNFNRTRFDPAQDLEQTVEIGSLMQAILNCLSDNRLVGDLNVTGDIFLTRRLSGEHGGKQIVAAHAL